MDTPCLPIATESNPTPMDEALRLATLGYSVFPCRPGTKKPATKHGFKDATRDPDAIRRWWNATPEANVAIATEGLLVLDLDGPDNAYLSEVGRLESLEQFPQSETPRGGRHFFMAQPAGGSVRISAGFLAPKVDVRADGGYVVVAPSLVGDRGYRWLVPLSVGPESLPAAPEWLASALRTRPVKSGSDLPDVLPEGERNSGLTRLAGQLRRRGMDEPAITKRLLELNLRLCVPPLEEREVRLIAASIAGYPVRERHAEIEVIIGPDEGRVNDEVIAALSEEPALYKRGKHLVRVIPDSAGAPVIQHLPTASLREMASRRVAFLGEDKKGELVPKHPPEWCINQIEARGSWPELRELVAVSTFPVLRADGSIHQTPGYDPLTKVLYQPVREFEPLPEAITVDHVLEATLELADVVCDFRFVSECSRSVFYAAVLTLVARFAFSGPAPLFVFDANIRGAGKSLLAQIAGLIALGRRVPVSGYPDSDEEMRKQITAKLLDAQRMVILDNTVGILGCPSLDRLLTTASWEDRLLGRTQSVSLPAHTVWFATGNNVSLAGDTGRRVLISRMEVLDERPEDRGGFKHPDILGHVEAIQPRLLRAVLLWLAWYLRQERRASGLRPFGSFEGWSRLVRGAIVEAGFADPCQDQALVSDSTDRAQEELQAVVESLARYDYADRGFTSVRVVQDLYASTGNSAPAVTDLRLALENAINTRPGKEVTARRIGGYFRAHRKRVIRGMYLVSDGKGPQGQVWRVHRPPAPASTSARQVDDCADSDDSVRGRHSRSQSPAGCAGLRPDVLNCASGRAGLSHESHHSLSHDALEGDEDPFLASLPPPASRETP